MIGRPICFCVLALLAFHAWSQAGPSAAYPRRTVTILVPYSPGAATDILARACAQRFTEIFGQQFIVVNRDGATGAIGTELVAKAQPDGYTLLWGSSSPLAINPIFSGKLAYDSVRDFAPIGLFASISYILVVHPSVPAKSLRELIALAKARPGSLNYASSGAGGAPYLSAELMKTMAKVNVVHVPYKGTTLFMTDLISGQIEMAFTGIATSMGYLNNGRLRALAITGKQRSALMPDLPTMSEAGLPGYELINWYSLLAPAGTPREVINQLNAALLKSLEHPDIRKRIANEGAVPGGGSPEDLAALIKSDLVKYAKVLKEAGLMNK